MGAALGSNHEPGAACLCHAPPRSSQSTRHTCLPSSGGPAAGFRSTRRTKLIATIGPACDSEEMLEQLAVGWLWALLCAGVAASLPGGTAACRKVAVQCALLFKQCIPLLLRKRQATV